MGSTFSNDNAEITNAYGNNKEQLKHYCEELGYKPSKKLFDGDYIIQENKQYQGGDNT